MRLVITFIYNRDLIRDKIFLLECNHMNKLQGVFFDCWDTLISFRMKNPAWNFYTLKEHAINKADINWDEVASFCSSFYKNYYDAQLDYELKVEQILQLMVYNFKIELDCSIKDCTHEILIHLDPLPVEGIDEFLTFLEEKNIPYACLSNSVYNAEDTLALLEKLLPGHKFSFLLTSSQIGVKKPNPIFFKTGVNIANMNIDNCMYVGDKLLQDAYGSFLAGFGYSVWLNNKGDEEKQRLRLKELKGVDEVKCIDVNSYKKLMEIITQDEMA